ncbi:MAG: hypothetical protein MI802_29040 [Desulfobacterales bacterium]|nr:hypothetical protein [Desulfobacterales bacterium]
MKRSIFIILSFSFLLFFSGCMSISSVPSEMCLTDPGNRKINNIPGEKIGHMMHACADTMLKASPTDRAKDIDARVLSRQSRVVIEVDAILPDCGAAKKDQPVTYLCKYEKGVLISGIWMKGPQSE